MATVQRFEDLTFWQKSRDLMRDIYRTLVSCRDYGFKDQIQRASVSVMSNIAEGFERGTRQEFINYLYIAKGSAGEVRAQLYVACDVGYITPESFKTLKFKVEEISKLLAAFTKGVKGSKFQGLQRKSEKSKEKQDAEDFMRDACKQLSHILSHIHPHLYNPGTVKS